MVQPYVRGEERWVLAYEVPTQSHGNQTRYKTLIYGNSRKECVEAIPGIIRELTEFYQEATKTGKKG